MKVFDSTYKVIHYISKSCAALQPTAKPLDVVSCSEAAAHEARDQALLAEALAPRPVRHGAVPGAKKSAVLAGLMVGACLVGGATATYTPSPSRKTTPGALGACSPYASWSFDDNFDVLLTACCKQVNPARGLIEKIQACGSYTKIAASAPGIFLGGLGKPSDCPDSNTNDVYTTALYISDVVRNSTAFQCLTGLVHNPVLDP